MFLLAMDLSDPIVLIASLVVVIFLAAEVYGGYKDGFLDSAIEFLGFIIATVGAFLLKSPLSVFLYTKFPFFKLGGVYKGVTALNIIIYEFIAFFLVFIVIMILLKAFERIFKITERLVRLLYILAVPNKVLGALFGLVKGLCTLYFVVAIFKIGVSSFGFEMKESLADYILEVPVLKSTFGNTLDSLEEITILSKEYEDTKDKDEFNKKAFEILIENGIITKGNLEILINSDKVEDFYTVSDNSKENEKEDFGNGITK